MTRPMNAIVRLSGALVLAASLMVIAALVAEIETPPPAAVNMIAATP
jgi:hypothetical protein